MDIKNISQPKLGKNALHMVRRVEEVTKTARSTRITGKLGMSANFVGLHQTSHKMYHRKLSWRCDDCFDPCVFTIHNLATVRRCHGHCHESRHGCRSGRHHGVTWCCALSRHNCRYRPRRRSSKVHAQNTVNHFFSGPSMTMYVGMDKIHDIASY